jgi:hypothetical protein
MFGLSSRADKVSVQRWCCPNLEISSLIRNSCIALDNLTFRNSPSMLADTFHHSRCPLGNISRRSITFAGLGA